MDSLLLRLLLGLFARLPLTINQTVGGILGRLIWYLSPKLRRQILSNLEHCFPERSQAWRTKIGRCSLMETTRSLTEAPWLWRQDANKLRSLLKYGENSELIDVAGEQGQAIIATPHLGSWEFAGLCLATLRPTTALYRPPRLSALDHFLQASRSRTGSRLVPTTPTGIRALRRALEAGEVVGMLPDQTPKGSGGVFAPFFGQPAYTMRLLGQLAKRHHSPVTLAFCERLPRGEGFCVHCVAATQAIYDDDPVIAATELNRCVENLVRLCPSQYLWSYRRFSRQPPSSPT